MSDPYSPYQAPAPYPDYGGYPAQAAVPMPGIARAAAIMMASVGVIVLLGSILLSLLIVNIPIDQLRETGALDDLPPDMDPATAMRIGAGFLGVCGGVLGLIYLVLAPFVWKGSRGSIIASAILVSLSLLLAVFFMLATLAQRSAQAVVGAMMYLFIALVLGVLLFLLIRSLAALRRREQAMAGYQNWPGYHEQQQPPPPQQGTGWGPPQP